jgi:CheY-like chemotaxis protein
MKTLRIIIAEDDEDEILFIKKGFLSTGLFEIVSIAKNGEVLIDAVMNLEILPDVILSDLNMPKKSGYEILQELKKNQDFSGIPIIIMSTSSTPSNIDRCNKLGAHSYLVKPETFNEYPQFAKIIYEKIIKA